MPKSINQAKWESHKRHHIATKRAEIKQWTHRLDEAIKLNAGFRSTLDRAMRDEPESRRNPARRGFVRRMDRITEQKIRCCETEIFLLEQDIRCIEIEFEVQKHERFPRPPWRTD